MIGAVVLAAGASRRLGQAKQLVRVGGRSLVRRAAEAALEAGAAPVVVVLGADGENVRNEIEGLPVQQLDCVDWEQGMSASLRAGVAAVAASPDVTAVLLLPCDLSALDAGVLRRLIDAFHERPGCRVACAYADTLGTPALFPRAEFVELLALRGDRGAKGLLVGKPGTVQVAWPEGARDVDRAEDLPG